MQEFKDYIRQHRDEMDVETPPPFKGNTVSARPRSVLQMKWMAAASVLVVLSGAIFWGVQVSVDESTSRAENIKTSGNAVTLPQPDSLKDLVQRSSETQEKSIATVQKQVQLPHVIASHAVKTSRRTRVKSNLKSPASQSMEASYAEIISYQLTRLERTPIYAETADYFHVFKKQWYDLETDEKRIKADIEIFGLNDMLTDQFIQLYQQKISLLKQLQTEITKMNIKARSNPELQKQTPTYLKM